MKTYKYLLILFVSISFNSSAQSWLWARQGTTNSDLTAVAADSKGNVYITAPYFDSITFGSNHLFTTFGLTGGGSYVVKYDSLGNIVWVTQPKVFSGYPNEFLYTFSNAIDNNNDMYITGQDAGLATFGKDSVTTGVNGYGFIPYLVKYDENGNVLWTRQARNNEMSNDVGQGDAVTTDILGNVYITGLFEDTLTFGADTVKDIIPNNNNVFIVKYDTKGNVLWAKQANLFSSMSSANGNSVGTDQLGNVYLTGYFTGTINFGSNTLNGINNISLYDVFIVKYNPNGNVLWAKQGNIPSSASGGSGYSVITDKANNVYLTGYFRDTLAFGTDTLKEQVSRTGFGFYGDIFLIKYDANGNILWTKESSNTSDTTWGWSGYSLSMDAYNHIYMTAGGFLLGTGKVIFGIDTFSYNAVDKDPAIAMELDTAGEVLCFSNVISGGDDQSLLVSDPTGKYVYWGGDFWTSTVVLGKDTIVQYPNSTEYPFIARWQSCTVPIDTNQLPVTQEPCHSLFIPNAFSPNKDGQNDILYVRGDCISSMDFIIFDRWGAKVFESNNVNYGWDGTYKGKPMNTASFAYFLKAVLLDGTTVQKKGNITLVR
ncbi:MAG TPA: gliding motility-associated C-terminal domain-containing protein [Bacteroidia bacterium]|nr:gliding motility-associated C-terminal domain-containing protein [Bacteroidia bacterium]